MKWEEEDKLRNQILSVNGSSYYNAIISNTNMVIYAGTILATVH